MRLLMLSFWSQSLATKLASLVNITCTSFLQLVRITLNNLNSPYNTLTEFSTLSQIFEGVSTLAGVTLKFLLRHDSCYGLCWCCSVPAEQGLLECRGSYSVNRGVLSCLGRFRREQD